MENAYLAQLNLNLSILSELTEKLKGLDTKLGSAIK